VQKLGQKLSERMGRMSGRAVGQGIVRASTRAGVDYTAWDERTRGKSVKAADMASAANPSTIGRDVALRLSAVGMGAPEAVSAAVTAAERASSYLQRHAPNGVSDVGTAVPHISHVPDDMMAAWEARRRAIDRPETLMRDLEAGKTPRPEAVEAIREVFPELFQQNIVAPIMNEVEHQTARGATIDYDTAARLSSVTGVPISPLDSPMLASVIGRALEPRPESKPRPPSGGDEGKGRSDRAETEATRVMT
jgi:hypothetical protein